MNNEIKEILDRLERIDHKEYSCGFEFADSGSFDEDCRCFEERKKMADYITNLQQENENNKKAINLFKDDLANMTYQYAKEKDENERLKQRNEEIYKGYMSVVDELTEYAEENERLKYANKVLEENWKHYMMRCGKAIEYINKHKVSDTITFPLMKREQENQVKSCFDYEFEQVYKEDLLNILQNGSDNVDI